MTTSIFNRIRSDFVNRKIVVVTSPNKSYEGILTYCDDEGNLTLSTELGLVLIQRKFISSVVLPKGVTY
jgi:small nuclear ribonucleoprotein (snRNP)-like protein